MKNKLKMKSCRVIADLHSTSNGVKKWRCICDSNDFQNKCCHSGYFCTWFFFILFHFGTDGGNNSSTILPLGNRKCINLMFRLIVHCRWHFNSPLFVQLPIDTGPSKYWAFPICVKKILARSKEKRQINEEIQLVFVSLLV